jgi:hypothetical protein
MPQFSPATPPLRPTPEFALFLVNRAANLPRAGNRHRHGHRTQQQFKHIPSHHAAPTDDRDFATLSQKQKYT